MKIAERVAGVRQVHNQMVIASNPNAPIIGRDNPQGQDNSNNENNSNAQNKNTQATNP